MHLHHAPQPESTLHPRGASRSRFGSEDSLIFSVIITALAALLSIAFEPQVFTPT
ncbi:hypothetical protein CABS01_13037 [Colletotrichum abscissum]|uniref:uncharacterized protein n=1 Tax=Colletotrichum abscissum TaxID=1671311 RepID=UPI0027D5AFC8|nr:uncharacterized protein CABS01_13037 [Colletotrichum abscissum]KAK1486904.1 hypothetical protein CABS01_13037 [Colletotrichum abscissum]